MNIIDDISDNEIRIIGSENHIVAPTPSSNDGSAEPPKNENKRNRWKGIAIALFFLIAIVIASLVTLYKSNNKRIVIEEINDVDSVELRENETVTVKQDIKASVVISEDTINDIGLIVLTPEGCHPRLHLGRIDTLDSNILLCAHAADVRGDNGEIVSAYVLDGEPKSRGVAKRGFCAIINDTVSLGMAEETSLYERVVETKGSFFRQYPLVHDSQMIENRPKGKAVRKSLCMLDGKVCIILSKERESFHDFAQALADYGVSEALALTGGESTLFARDTNGKIISYGNFNYNYKNNNYIVFEK